MTDRTSNERCKCPNGSHGQKHTTACYEARIQRLQAAVDGQWATTLWRCLNRLHYAVKGCASIGFEESSPVTNERHAGVWNDLNVAQKDAAFKLEMYSKYAGSPSETNGRLWTQQEWDLKNKQLDDVEQEATRLRILVRRFMNCRSEPPGTGWKVAAGANAGDALNKVYLDAKKYFAGSPQEPKELPESLRDPIKVMERGRELLANWGQTPLTDAALGEPYLQNRANGVHGVYCIARQRDGITEYWTGEKWAAFCDDLYFDLRPAVETTERRWFDGGYLSNGRCQFMEATTHGCCCLPHAHEGPHRLDSDGEPTPEKSTQQLDAELMRTLDSLESPQKTSGELPPAFQSLLDLQPHWDSYGGIPPLGNCLAKARQILPLLPGEWSVVPMSNGGIQLEQHTGGLDIELMIENSPEKASALPTAYKPECEGGTGGRCTQPDCEVCWPDKPENGDASHD